MKRYIKSDATDDFFPGTDNKDKMYFAMDFNICPDGTSDTKSMIDASFELIDWLENEIDIVDYDVDKKYGGVVIVIQNEDINIGYLISNLKLFETKGYQCWAFHFRTQDTPYASFISVFSNGISNDMWYKDSADEIEKYVIGRLEMKSSVDKAKSVKSSRSLDDLLNDNEFLVDWANKYNKYYSMAKTPTMTELRNFLARTMSKYNLNFDELKELRRRASEINSSFIVKRNRDGKYLGWSGTPENRSGNTIWVDDEKSATKFDSKEYIEKYKGELMGVDGLDDEFTVIESSRKPIKSGMYNPYKDPYEDDYMNPKFYNVITKNGELVEKHLTYNKAYEIFNKNPRQYDIVEDIKSSRKPIKSNLMEGADAGRYVVTNPDDGTVLGSADTYEEAVENFGDNVTITDSEATEGQGEENMDTGLFSSWDNDTPRGEGWLAHDDGKQKTECPYNKGTDEYEDWINGWEAAYQEVNSSRKPIKSGQAAFDKAIEKKYNGTSPNGAGQYYLDWKYNLADEKDNIKRLADKNGLSVEFQSDEGYFEVYSSRKTIKSGRGWNLGYNAYYNGKSQTDCPSDLSEEDTFEWMDGWDYAEDEDRNDEIESSKTPTGDKAFLSKIVSAVSTKEMSEEEALKRIALRNNCNKGFAKNIFNEAMKDETLLASGIMAIADDLNKDFDIDGNIESWTEDYMKGSGKSTTVGGEILRAFNRIGGRYYNDGDMIGRGYGKETVNPAARYLLDKVTDSSMQDIEDMLNGDSDINKSDDTYEEWVEAFQDSLENYLRNNEELFHTPNKDDMLDYATEDDRDTSVTECYVTDGNGNEYWFDSEGNGDWRCNSIEFGSSPEFEVGDTIDEEQIAIYADVPEGDDYVDFADDGFYYSAEKVDDGEWEITEVQLENPLASESDYWSVDDLINNGACDANGYELSENDLYD